MHELLKSYMYKLQASLISSAYTRCWDNWREIDYTPSYNKFYLIIKGEGWIKIGDKEYHPKPGELYLMPAGVKQSFSTINENHFEKYWDNATSLYISASYGKSKNAFKDYRYLCK
jgi:ethanolamine utilization protein EutQ (cupin superfamily)